MGKPTTVPAFSACEMCGVTIPRRKYMQPDSRKWHYASLRFCSFSCRNKSRYVKSKGSIDKHGYRILTVDGKYIAEHRAVMEKILGRPLTRDETVHHRDGNRSNNAPDNLELWSSRHCPGQRVSEKIDFCRSFLAKYGDIPLTNMSEREIVGFV